MLYIYYVLPKTLCMQEQVELFITFCSMLKCEDTAFVSMDDIHMFVYVPCCLEIFSLDTVFSASFTLMGI